MSAGQFLGCIALVVLGDQLDLAALDAAAGVDPVDPGRSPARCSGSPDGPEKLPIVPMSRSDPDAATAELELGALMLVLALLLLLQAVARAATATLSADARSRVVLLVFFISGSNPRKSRPGTER